MGGKDKGIPQDTRQLSSPSRANLPAKNRNQMMPFTNLWAGNIMNSIVQLQANRAKVRFEFPQGIQGELTSIAHSHTPFGSENHEFRKI